MTSLFRLLVVAGALLLLPGCKLVIMVTSGGEVVSASGSHNCGSRRVCEIQISTDDFTETFTAIPAEGYEFEKWQGGSGFNCPGSTDPVCVVTNAGFLALFGEFAVTYLGSDKIDHLVPIFKWVGIDTDGDGTPNRFDEDDDNDGLLDGDDPCPLNPDLGCGVGAFVAADGKIWYQPDLFINASHAEIESVCPAGVCEGLLEGFNMDGWIWASAADMESLLGYYGFVNFYLPDSTECDAGSAFFSDLWRMTNGTIGLGANEFNGLAGWISGGFNRVAAAKSCAANIWIGGLGFTISPLGAWFYQEP